MTGAAAGDYVLGTNDEEIARLGVQHRVWRPRVMDAWRRAGIGPGQTVIDLGAGPGYASFDLADLVGPTGRVLAVERSRRFLDALERERDRRLVPTIATFERDLDEADLPPVQADAVWGRWIFAFVKQPRRLVTKVRAALKPGGVVILYEYLDYATWRLAPPSVDFDEFVAQVMKSWRLEGGEPNVGLELPQWLDEAGFELRRVAPMIDVVGPTSDIWQWPRRFVDVGLRRLAALGHLSEERAGAIWQAFLAREAQPHVLMVTPLMAEIVAIRPA